MAVRARRALISVFDKLGLEELVRALAELDIEFVSTGGTAKAIRRLGSAPMWRRSPVSRDAGRRVKTLHPASTEACWPSATCEHLATLLQHQISPIDIVCVNLYHRQTIQTPGVPWRTPSRTSTSAGRQCCARRPKPPECVRAQLTGPMPRTIARLRADRATCFAAAAWPGGVRLTSPRRRHRRIWPRSWPGPSLPESPRRCAMPVPHPAPSCRD